MTLSTSPVALPKEGDSLLGKYTLEKPLGQGGMGIVYAARHDLLGQRVAVKFLLPAIASNREAVARFVNEARAASRIESDHVARVFDVGVHDGVPPYMVLEFLQGDDLAVVLSKRGPLPTAEVADHLLQAVEALAHAHTLGIVHRDLKPSNLFLARRPDGTQRVKVLDFGISKLLGQGVSGGDLTRTNAILGSPLYMSPEQLRDSKSVDHRCDIWALGVIAYELLTGRPPFMGDNAVALFAAISESDPASLRSGPDSGIPEAFESAVVQCLRRDPNERFPSVTALGASLLPFSTEAGKRAFENAQRIHPLEVKGAADPYANTVDAVGVSVLARASIQPPSAAPPSPKRRWMRGGALAGGLALVVGTGVALEYRHATGAESGPPNAASANAEARVGSAGAPSASASAAPVPSAAAPPLSLSPSPSPSLAPAAPASPPPTAKASTTTIRSPPRRPSASVAPSRNCDPPYTIDSADGHHILKAGCE